MNASGAIDREVNEGLVMAGDSVSPGLRSGQGRPTSRRALMPFSIGLQLLQMLEVDLQVFDGSDRGLRLEARTSA